MRKTELQKWLTDNPHKDADLAVLLKISRPSASRIRRGKNPPSKKTAQKLEKLTGIPWHQFIHPTRVSA